MFLKAWLAHSWQIGALEGARHMFLTAWLAHWWQIGALEGARHMFLKAWLAHSWQIGALEGARHSEILLIRVKYKILSLIQEISEQL